MANNTAQRPSFYEGQFLGAEDLDALVDYQRQQLSRHALGFHAWGIATGLEIKTVEAAGGGDAVDLFIQPGYAIDGFGRTITLTTPKPVPVELFEDIETSGHVKLWIGYKQIETASPAEGFRNCSEEEQFGRVVDSFELFVGDRSHAAEHDPVNIAGDEVDAMQAFYHLDSDENLICDESIPFQIFPEEIDKSRWLIPLGYVYWNAAGGGSSGWFGKLTDAGWIRRARAERVYAGVVAESLYAADGALRLRRRDAAVPASGSISDACTSTRFRSDNERDLSVAEEAANPVDLVWVEGTLRALGDVRMFGTKLDFRNSEGEWSDAGGDEEPIWLRRIEDNTPGPGGRDLQAVIGAKSDGKNRFSVGPRGEIEDEVEKELQTKFTVVDNGHVGIATDNPETFLHVDTGADIGLGDPGVVQVGESGGTNLGINQGQIMARNNGATSTLSLNSKGGNVVVASEGDGRFGVGLSDPGGKLHIEGGNAPGKFAKITTALEIDHAGNEKAILQANGINGPYRISVQDGHGRVSHTWNAYDSAGDHRYDRSSESAMWLQMHDGFALRTATAGAADGVVSWNLGLTQATSGKVGINVEDSAYGLNINHHLAEALSVGLGSDSGRIWTDYTNLSPTLIFYDRDDRGGILRFRESPSTDDEDNPEFEAVIAGKRGSIGIGTIDPDAGSALSIEGNAGGLRMYSGRAGGHFWMGFYTDGGPGTARAGYFGFPSDGDPNLAITNEKADGDIVLWPERHVGISTWEPQAHFHVRHSISGNADIISNHVAIVENTSTTTNADVLALKVGRTSGLGTGNNFITFFDGNDDIGAIQATGTGIMIDFNSADYAEWLPMRDAEEKLEAGDVVAVIDGQVTRNCEDAHRLMVISTAPVIAGNRPGSEQRDNYRMVAFLGQVPVRVKGKVGAGDWLVASGDDDGTAVAIKKLDKKSALNVVGQAWESSAEEKASLVNCYVGDVGYALAQLLSE